jgi:hypothetical protein
MGTSVYLLGAFYKTSWDGSTIVSAHEAFERAGFASEPKRDPETVKYDNTTTDMVGREAIETAAENLAEGQQMEIRYDGGPDSISITYRAGPEVGDLPMPVGIGHLDAYYFDPEAVGDDAVTERVTRFSDAFIEVANAIDPAVGYLKLRNDHAGMEGIPRGTDPSEHGPEKLPFVLVLSESWVEHCGGHDHVMDAPVHRTQALNTGGIAIQVTERPDLNGDYHDGAAYFFDS